jgi:AcrR family transcriptional regulator
MRVKSETRRQNILSAAKDVFRELGFGAASMSEICARAGGSKATLYSYFSSKDELFAAAMREFAETHMEDVFRLLDPAGSPSEALHAFGARFLGLISRPELVSSHRTVFAEACKSEVGKLFYRLGPEEGLKQLASYLAACMQQGTLREADSRIAAQHLIGLLKSESMDRLLFGVDDGICAGKVAAIAERAVAVFLRAYAP